MSKILIIDGEGTLGGVLQAVLSRAGHHVAATANGAAGLDAYKRDRPDLVLLDRDLPDMTGAKVMRSLKEADPRANVIVLNRHVDPEGEVKFRRAGARVFLAKAVGIETLLRLVERSLKQKFGMGVQGLAEKPEILIIDDDPGVRSVLRQFLEKKGYEVSAAEDGASALRMVGSAWPQMILMDVNMPKMNGVKLLQAVRRINKRVPIAMITGQEDLETARECLRLGAFDYIAKPVNFEYLETSVWGKLLSTRA